MAHRRTWVLALAAVASLMTALDALVVSASLTTIQADLGATAEQLEWTVNGYNLVMAVLLMPAAALGDRYGRRRMFAVGIVLFTAASAACAAAPGVVVLVLARAVQGAGAAFVSALAMTLVSAPCPAERRGSAIGVLQGGSRLGGSMSLAPTANAVLGAVPPADMGKASGVNAMVRELGGVLGLAVFVAVFTATGGYASAAAFVDGFGPAMGACAALVVLSAAAVAVRRRPAVRVACEPVLP